MVVFLLCVKQFLRVYGFKPLGQDAGFALTRLFARAQFVALL
ncbi:hypothetical protein [Thiomicrorhabdus aquaedulcis]|nr:hypothetical protein [Thiomicrorhabdus aquaedulcis]